MKVTSITNAPLFVEIEDIALIWDCDDPIIKARSCIQTHEGAVLHVKESKELLREMIAKIEYQAGVSIDYKER